MGPSTSWKWLGVVLGLVGCTSSTPPKASAVQVRTRDELIGGPRALGDVGDFKLSNGIIQAIIQNTGHSRGFGVFGGSLIDLDLVRGSQKRGSLGGSGNDNFTEMFPAFFLEAIAPESVSIVNDGSDGNPAVVRVSGSGDNFISLTKALNELALPGPKLTYHVDYVLEPGKQYVKVVSSLVNEDTLKPASFPLPIPFGLILLMGSGQSLFVPGKAGFDIRHRFDDVYKQPSDLNALPGEVTTMVLTEGEGVSYGFFADPQGGGYVSRPEVSKFYPTARPDSMLIPAAASSFLGCMWGMPPRTTTGAYEIAPGKTYSYTGYVAVGSGSVSSVQAVVQEAKGTQTGVLSGRVREQGTGAWLAGVRVVAENAKGELVSATRTLEDGTYSMNLPPDRYRVIAVDDVRGRAVSADDVERYRDVEAGGKAQAAVELPRPSYLSVRVVAERGEALPAKISVEAIAEPSGGKMPRQFLYDLRAGERMRPSDLEPDSDDDEGTRKYLEAVFFAPNGVAGRALRPGRYRVYVSRGIEYELWSTEVELKAGQNRGISVKLRQVMPTPDYLSADFHVHSVASVDSNIPFDERVTTYAAEGVDFIASTDHNQVSDLGPVVESLGLSDWLRTTVGLELSTLEMGHFNAYPLVLNPGPITHGSFNWFREKPDTLFGRLRGLGKHGPEKTIVQVNHPNDGLLGYFSAFNFGSYSGTALPNSNAFGLDRSPDATGEPSPYALENFSLDFDVLEVFNGKHFEDIHHYRIPANPGEGKEPTVPIPAVGEILEKVVKVPKVAAPTTEADFTEVSTPVFPGVLDDYYTLIARGRRITAVGNSDSHGSDDEAGLPRTYVNVGEVANGTMRRVDERVVVEGLQQHRAIVTNGPFVELFVNDNPVGSTVVAPEGKVTVRVKVQAAPWVDVSEVVIKRGGRDQEKVPFVVKVFPVAASDAVVRLEETFELEGLPDNSFLVAEVSGQKSLWPVFTPYEVASVQLSDAIGTMGESFGFSDKYGKYRPVLVQQVKPFAFTNPIWVNRTVQQSLRARRVGIPLVEQGTIQREPQQRFDLRAIFQSFHGH